MGKHCYIKPYKWEACIVDEIPKKQKITLQLLAQSYYEWYS